ncbi:MAG: hypothetical protein ABSB15_01355 [Bryobacteraceae bacterium]|jgi:hypothetical protein
MTVSVKLFFDTNVCDKLLKPPYLVHLAEIKTAIRKHYRIVISSETFIELMRTFKGGSGEFFKHDQNRMRVMAGWGAYPTFLSLPGEFTMKQSLGLNVPAAFGPTWFRKTLKTFLAATSRRQLFEDGVPMGKHLVKFDPEIIEQQHKAGEESHRKWLQDAASGQYIYPPPERWAVGFGEQLGVTLSPEQATTLANDLSAMYAFRKASFEIASKNKNYRWDNRDGDWVDGQQLGYLCDPSIRLVTDEQPIRQKCATSQQSQRVLLLSEFVANLGITI